MHHILYYLTCTPLLLISHWVSVTEFKNGRQVLRVVTAGRRYSDFLAKGAWRDRKMCERFPKTLFAESAITTTISRQFLLGFLQKMSRTWTKNLPPSPSSSWIRLTGGTLHGFSTCAEQAQRAPFRTESIPCPHSSCRGSHAVHNVLAYAGHSPPAHARIESLEENSELAVAVASRHAPSEPRVPHCRHSSHLPLYHSARWFPTSPSFEAPVFRLVLVKFLPISTEQSFQASRPIRPIDESTDLDVDSPFNFMISTWRCSQIVRNVRRYLSPQQ
jgi:hypothetical protein